MKSLKTNKHPVESESEDEEEESMDRRLSGASGVNTTGESSRSQMAMTGRGNRRAIVSQQLSEAPGINTTGESSRSQMGMTGSGERRAIFGPHRMWWDEEWHTWHNSVLGAVLIENPSKGLEWYNIKNDVWLDKEGNGWYRWPQPDVVGKGKGRVDSPSQEVSTGSRKEVGIDICAVLRTKKSDQGPSTSLLKQIYDIGSTLALRVHGMVRIHICHKGVFRRPHKECLTTHDVSMKVMARSLFHMHEIKGGVRPTEDTALIQLGFSDMAGTDDSIIAYYWNPADETTIQQTGWNLNKNEVWLGMTSS